jgi:phage tail sheath protein FI
MPEYLAPGVYVEETSFRSKSIEGVSTTTTGLVGPCRYGPIDLTSELVTSLEQFEELYGTGEQLRWVQGSDEVSIHNYLWHGVRAFFAEGGKRLYVARLYRRGDGLDGVELESDVAMPVQPPAAYSDGYARHWQLPSGGGVTSDDGLLFRARYPGSFGNFKVSLTFRASQSVLRAGKLVGAASFDVAVAVGPLPADVTFCLVKDVAGTLKLFDGSDAEKSLVGLTAVYLVSADVAVLGTRYQREGLALDHRHQRSGEVDSLTEMLAWKSDDPSFAQSAPIVVTRGSHVTSGLEVLDALATTAVKAKIADPESIDVDRTVTVTLAGGADGRRPEPDDYEGGVDKATMRKTGLKKFEDIEDISIVAAPGATFAYETVVWRPKVLATIGHLIGHAERMRYRIAVLDSGNGQSIQQIRALRAQIDSKYAALYYPWVRVMDPITRAPIALPPSGFVAGIYARNDTQRAVYKAPANEVVTLAIGFETLLNKAQQDVLNPEGINAFRFFEGRGYRLWGARTISSDPEWKYVNLRRYFAYLERSIDRGTQWAVFEPNGEQLWGNVRRTIEDFLLNEWQSGALLGDKPEKSFFVRCDRSVMTQNDLDNGRLICLIGVAPLRPAEYVIFRIGQWTSDRRS